MLVKTYTCSDYPKSNSCVTLKRQFHEFNIYLFPLMAMLSNLESHSESLRA